MAQTKQEVLNQYASVGKDFIESYNHLRAAMMTMGGKPNSKSFRKIVVFANEIAEKAERCAVLCEKGENTKRNDNNMKFVSKPIDTTAKQI